MFFLPVFYCSFVSDMCWIGNNLKNHIKLNT